MLDVSAQSVIAARTRILSTCLHWVLTLFLAGLPFELMAGLPLAGLTFTNVELLALTAIGLWVALLLEQPGLFLPRRMATGAALLLVVFVASALLAGEWRGSALKFTARQLQGMLLGVCVADQLSIYGWLLVRRFGLALVAGASASAACGLLEISELPAVVHVLAIFKEQPTTAGGLLRLSATFAYANIAAMYYEAVLPIAMVACGLAQSRRGRWLLASCSVVLYLATLLTYSRAALLTATATVAIVALAAALLFRRAGKSERATRRRVIALGGGLVVIVAGLMLLSPTFRVRLAEPDVDRWYRADYSVVPIDRLAPNELTHTPVTVRNQGLVTWRPDGVRPIRLAYHWLDAKTRLVVRYNGYRTPVPLPVDPGQLVQFDAVVQAPPQPGDYVLVWDMVSEGSGWFSERGSSIAEVAVRVAGVPAQQRLPQSAEPAGLPQRIEVRTPPPARPLLWGAALRLWQTHPLLGIGPDLFRHIYGPELGLAVWDDRLHTNNLYIELLVGSGSIGLAAFLGLVTAVGSGALRALMRLSQPHRPDERAPRLRWVLLGCATAMAAFLIHGALDMFLEYSATYMLLWITLGALDSLAQMNKAGTL